MKLKLFMNYIRFIEGKKWRKIQPSKRNQMKALSLTFFIQLLRISQHQQKLYYFRQVGHLRENCKNSNVQGLNHFILLNLAFKWKQGRVQKRKQGQNDLQMHDPNDQDDPNDQYDRDDRDDRDVRDD